MQQYRIKRTNLDDLVFTGELLASVDDLGRTGDSVVGLQLVLYHTRVGVYVLAITVHDYRSSRPKILHGAVSFPNLEDIHIFLQSREGRGIADLVLLLLEEVARTGKHSVEPIQQTIPDHLGSMQAHLRQSGQS